MRVVAAVVTQKAPAREFAHLLLHQLLFVETVAQALLQPVAVWRRAAALVVVARMRVRALALLWRFVRAFLR
ncbi:hypothetical protein D3C71_2117620 [compost metagenome]